MSAGRNVIEKGREHPDQDEQREGALPFMRQESWQHDRDVTFLKVPRQQREAGQQAKQIDENDPLVFEMKKEAGRPGSGFESGENDLVDRDRRQTGESDPQGVMMKNRHAEQSEPEENEIDRDPEEERHIRHGSESGGDHPTEHSVFRRARSECAALARQDQDLLRIVFARRV